MTLRASRPVASAIAAVLVLGLLPMTVLAAVPTTVPDTTTVLEDGSVLIDVLGNDDTDAGPLSVAHASDPSDGTTTVVGTSVRYIPNPNFHGSDSFTYVATNDDGDAAPESVSVTVTSQNDPPVADNETLTVAEDASATTVPVLTGDSDVDGDALEIQSASNPAHGTVVVAGDNLTLTYKPDGNYHGADNFTYVVTDGIATDTGSVSVTVTSQNDPPIADNETLTVAEDAGATGVPVLAGDTDADGDALTIDSASDPAHGTVVVAGNGLSLTYRPDANFHGADSFTYVVTDGIATDIGTVSVTVTSQNDPPVADNETITVAEDSGATTVPVLTGDSDPDGDPLSIQSASNPAHGTVVVAGNGLSLTYQPDSNYHGADSFAYVVTDGNGGTDTGTVSVTVTSQNDPPVADNETLTVAEDSGATAVPVLVGDTDADGDALTIVSASNPAHGTVVVAGNGLSLTYQPDANYHGADSFTYVVTDGIATDIGTVNVTVTSQNDPPIADNETLTLNEDASATIVPVLTGDTDADGDTLTIDSASDPAHGTVVVAGNGLSLTYQPDPNYHGADSFTYVLTDGIATDIGTVSVTVTSQNDPPEVVDDTASVMEDALPMTLFVLDNDSDVEGDTLTITAASNPPHGTSTVAVNGLSVTYEPDSGYSGPDTFTYTVSDGNGGVTVGTVTIDVSGVNGPPNAVNDLTQHVPEGAGPTVLDVLANDSDPDGDSYIVLSRTNAAHGTVTILPGGAGLTYDPVSLYHGTDTFKYTLRDAAGATDTATVVVTVIKDSTAPVVVAPAQRLLTQTVGTSTIKARIAWTGSDPGSGIKSYQFQVSVNGHAYTTIHLASLTRNFYDATLTNNATYRYRVRATDKEGNTSGYRYTATFKPSVFQETSGAATYVGAWSTSKTTSALGGAVRFTPTLGKTVSFSWPAWDIGLVMTKTTTSGSADIYVDGVLEASINLRTSHTTYRQLVFARHFTTLVSHTIEIRPTGTGRVDIDAFPVLR